MSCKRPHTVKATLTSEEYETFSALADKAGMTKAELIRYALIHRSDSLDDLVISKNDDGGRSKKLQPVSGDSDKKRSKVIYVKVSDDEHEAICKQADALGATVSAYARRVMLAGKIEKIDFDMSQVAKIYRELYSRRRRFVRAVSRGNESQSADVLYERTGSSGLQRESCFPHTRKGLPKCP